MITQKILKIDIFTEPTKKYRQYISYFVASAKMSIFEEKTLFFATVVHSFLKYLIYDNVKNNNNYKNIWAFIA